MDSSFGNHSLIESLLIQKRVIHALLIREILTRFGRNNIGFMWLFAEPMLFTVLVAVLWSFIRLHSDKYGINVYAFALTGYSTVMFWRNMPSHCIGAMKANTVLLYHKNVKAMDVYAARILLEGMGATMSFLILTIIYIWVGLIQVPENILLVILGWSMTGWFGLSLGLFIGTLSEFSDIVPKLWSPISYLLFPLSGAIFMVAYLPPQMQNVILLLPMVHGVECIRDGFFGSIVETRYDLSYMASVNLVLMIMAVAQLRILSKNINLTS